MPNLKCLIQHGAVAVLLGTVWASGCADTGAFNGGLERIEAPALTYERDGSSPGGKADQSREYIPPAQGDVVQGLGSPEFPIDSGESEDDPTFVRETGFRSLGDSPDEVRETGFLPAPELRIVSFSDGAALLAWSVVEEADAYVLMGIRYDNRGQPVTSFMKEFAGQTGWVDAQGLQTRVRVTAVSFEPSARSKASNEVELPAEED